MKKTGILNRHLSGELARLGHTDLVMVCDAGLPIPDGPAVVDLAFRAGTPSFAEVLEGILDELEVEGATAADEVYAANPEAGALLDRLFPGTGDTAGTPGSGLELVPHDELKARTHNSRLVVRTGECRPYANVLLRCGVPF